MTKRNLTIIGMIGLLAATFPLWSGSFRRIDGKNAADWLALTERTTRAVDYHAAGQTVVNGRTAQFTLDQAHDGRYLMQVAGATPCAMGCDGRHIWSERSGKVTNIADAGAPLPPGNAASRLAGVMAVAGRPAVLLHVNSGAVRKVIAVDRETGVMLAMSTYYHDRLQSDMRVEQVDFHPVALPALPHPEPANYHRIDDAAIRRFLGRTALEPSWLPNGMTAAGAFRGFCGCCKREMVVKRYTSGAAALTLFEMAGPPCAMGDGCRMVSSGQSVIASRVIDGIAITAVGDVDAASLKKVLDHVR